jgi:hypothetical protein
MTASSARCGNLAGEEQAVRPTPIMITSNRETSALYLFEFILLFPAIG